MRSLTRAPGRIPAAIGVIALLSVVFGASSALADAPASATAIGAVQADSEAAASDDCTILVQGAVCTFGVDGGSAHQISIAEGVERVTVVVSGGAGGLKKTRVGGMTTAAELRAIDSSRILTIEVGAKGAKGESSKVSWNDPSMSRPLIIAGGGLGAESGVDHSRVSVHESVLGEIDVDGYVTVIGGELVPYFCIDSHDARTLEVPEGVKGYYVLAAGGAGSHENNAKDTAGRGAAVSGVIDTRGEPELQYWVGCSGFNGGNGYGVPGKGVDVLDYDGLDSGNGGGATLIGLPGDDGQVTPLIAAGGGGGAGGTDLCTLEGEDCDPDGVGGNGGGVKGAKYDLNGTDGDDGDGGTGGCGACSDPVNGTHNGTTAYEFSGGGGGGGGGSGYPLFGHGGGAEWAKSGGGGGAGGSYTAQYLVEDGRIATTAAATNGFLLMVALAEPTTTLTVSKEVTGDAASGQDGAVFTMRAFCAVNEHGRLDETFSIAAGIPIVLDGVPLHGECTVTETDAAGASTPATPQTVQVGDGPASITMTNDFAAGGFGVTVHSHGHDADGNTVEGVAFDAGMFRVGVACHLDGRFVQIPNGGGLLTFRSEDTFAADGATKQVTGVPIGAECEISQLPVTDVSTSFEVNGEAQSGDTARVTVTADTQQVGVTNAFPFAPLSVSKTAAGDGVAPSGYSYGFSASCTYRGEPVTLATGGDHLLVAAGATQSFPSLFPVGSACTVTETDRGGATSVQFPDGATASIVTDGAVVSAVNTFSTDPLTATLTTSGSGAAWANATDTVDVQIACTLDGAPQPAQTVTIPATGGTASVDVTDGSECAVQSVASAGQVSTRYASSAATNWSDDPVAVTVTSAAGADLAVDLVFDAAPITVESSNSGEGAKFANIPTAATISECTFRGRAAQIGGADAVTIPFTMNGGSGEAMMVVGAECHVAQTTAGGATRVEYSPGTDDSGTIVTVGADGATASIENVFELGALSVTQTNTGDAAWAANVDTAVQVACTFNELPLRHLGVDGIATVRFDPTGALIPSAAADALSALPQGANCAAEETEPGGASSVTYSPDASAVVATDSTITVTNTFDTATYSVGVEAAGNDAASHTDDVFTFTQMCTFNGDKILAPQTDPAWSAQLELGVGETAVISGLPVGAECAVSEIGAGHATSILPASEQTFTLPSAPATPTVLAGGRVDIVFTMVFDATSLTVTQAVDGAGAETYAADAVFDDQLVCWYPGDGTGVVFPDRGVARLSAASGWSLTFNVPVGADCDVQQANAMMATSVEVPDTVVVGAEPISLTVTNSYLLGQFTVSAEAMGTDAQQAEFGFDTTCVWPGAGTALPLNSDADPAFTLKPGESWQFEALAGASCSVSETAQNDVLEVTATATGTDASTDGAVATALADVEVPAQFTFHNYLAGSLPPTGLAIGGSLIAAMLLFGTGIVLLTMRMLRRKVSDAVLE